MYGSSISYLLLTQTRSPEKAYQKGLSPYIISLSTAAKKARISHCIMTFPQRGGDKGKFLLKRGYQGYMIFSFVNIFPGADRRKFLLKGGYPGICDFY